MSQRPLRLAVALNGYGLDHDEPDGGHRDILSWEELASLATLAEELGYEAIFAPEIRGWEAFTTLTGMAARTNRIGLASGVIPLSSRDPERLAMGAASLQELSGGRFALGVGSDQPIERTAVLLRQLRELLQTGHGHDHMRGEAWDTDWAHAPRAVRLYLAALGPRMTGLAGEAADGVILNWCTPERVARARAAVGDRDGFTIAVYVRACLSHVDEHADEALRVAASRYAQMEPYRRQFAAMGLDPADTDGLVAAVCVAGGRGDPRDRFQEYADAGADLVVVYPVPAGEAVSSLGGTLMAAGPQAGLEG